LSGSFQELDVSVGSLADIAAAPPIVRFTPKADIAERRGHVR
jgi:hypothetical protein